MAAGNEERLWTAFNSWTQDEGFDYETASARMLGHDIRPLLMAKDAERIRALLAEQADVDIPGRLPNEIDPSDTIRPRTLLGAMLQGFSDVSPGMSKPPTLSAGRN